MTIKPEEQNHQCECAICRAGNDPVTTQYHQPVNLLLSRLTEPQRRWYAGVLSQQPDRPSDRQLGRSLGWMRRRSGAAAGNLATDVAVCPWTGSDKPGADDLGLKKRPAVRAKRTSLR